MIMITKVYTDRTDPFQYVARTGEGLYIILWKQKFGQKPCFIGIDKEKE